MKTQTYILRGFLAVTIVLACALFTSGCTGPKPIKTTLNVDEATQLGGLPAFDYSSEKDVLLSKREIHPETGIVYELDFKALASAAAYAQAEREVVEAQARAAQANALERAVTALGNNAANVLAAPPPAP